jgi:hypothetical protein
MEEPSSDANHGIFVGSMQGVKTGLPWVRLVVTGKPISRDGEEEPQSPDRTATVEIQMSPEEAIRQAEYLVNASVSALADGFVVDFLRERLNLTDDRAIAMIVQEFRVFRELRQAAEAIPEGMRDD